MNAVYYYYYFYFLYFFHIFYLSKQWQLLKLLLFYLFNPLPCRMVRSNRPLRLVPQYLGVNPTAISVRWGRVSEVVDRRLRLTPLMSTRAENLMHPVINFVLLCCCFEVVFTICVLLLSQCKLFSIFERPSTSTLTCLLVCSFSLCLEKLYQILFSSFS